MSTSTLVAVTGANGFLGSHVVSQLLAEGTKTRAIVRSKASASSLEAAFPEQIQKGLLQFAYVPDIATHGPVYDEAFQGVTGLIHTASPIFQVGGVTVDKENTFLKPAIFGLINAVEAAHRTKTIKKVVVTSSVSAANPPNRIGTLKNDYFPPTTYEEAAKLERDNDAYAASKSLAEKAAWDFVRKSKSSFQLTTILAGLIIGPSISGKSESSGSNGIALAMAKAPQNIPSIPMISVQDTAAAHISALKQPETDGKRVFAVERIMFAHDAVLLAKQHVPNFPAGDLLPYPEKGKYLDIDEEQRQGDAKMLNLTAANTTDEVFVQLLRENM